MISSGPTTAIRLWVTPAAIVVMRQRAQMDEEAAKVWQTGIPDAQMIEIRNEKELTEKLADAAWVADRPIVGAVLGDHVPGDPMIHPSAKPRPTLEVVVAALLRKGVIAEADLKL